jgi:hypothetical protein
VSRYISLLFLTIVFISFLPLGNNAYGQEDTDKKKSEPQAEEMKDEIKEEPLASPKPQRSAIDIIKPVDALENKISDLKHYLTSDVVQPLLVGPDDHITLIHTNNAINSKGIMILLPDWQQSASNPKALNALRESLPDQGWTTISVLPPNKPNNYPSHAIEKAQREEENKSALKDYQQQLSTILSAVTEKAKSYPGIIVVVAEGHNAAILLSIYQEEMSDQPTALIMLGAHLNDDLSNIKTATDLSQLDLPVLDLYLKADNRLAKINANLRQKWVNQELKSNFRQRKIYNIQTGYYPKPSLISEINGWLKSIGW